MIQVLENNPSFGERLGASVGQGIGGGLRQGYQSALMQKLKKEAEAAKEAADLKKLQTEYGLKGGLLEKEYGLKGEQKKQEQELQIQMLENIRKGRGGTTQNQTSPSENLPSQEIPQNSQRPDRSTETLENQYFDQAEEYAAMGFKDLAKTATDKAKALQKDRLEHTKEVTASYGENKEFINKTYDQYEDSLRREGILDRMQQLDEEGNLSGPGIINALETLGLQPEWLQNAANDEFNKLSLDLLGGGTLQADYGSRIFASEFKVAQQRIPQLMQTPEGRRQIEENIRTALLPSKLKNERMQYYLDRAERTGEPLPHDLRGRILKDIKPQLEEAYDKFKQRNGRYTVKEGTTPDDNAIEKYYYLSNGDEAKARKMMIQDGYDLD
jgi:hypothetical protein